ncbi:MAG: DNA polymerase III subunit beta [Patescibacteria group bacterium]
MKLVAVKNNLKEAISSVEKISRENLSLPILKNVLFEATDSKLKIITTNLELAITCSVAGKIIEKGKLTIPVSIFSGIINNLQTERINLETKDNKLVVTTDNYEAEIQGTTAEDFPITPKIKDTSEYIEIKGNVLKTALTKVLVATQFSDLRPELNSIFFNFFENGLKLAATDSFRLAEATINKEQFNSSKKDRSSFLVPLRTVHEFVRVIKDEDIVKIYNDDSQVLFKTEQLELLSRLVEGNFPDYEAIIPKKFITEVLVDRQEFTSALRLVGVFGTKNSEIKIRSKEGKKVLEISSADPAVGENKYLLPAKIQGKLDEIIFNWRYLMDALKAVEGQEIFFGINKENEPAELKQVGDSSYVYILKPVSSA